MYVAKAEHNLHKLICSLPLIHSNLLPFAASKLHKYTVHSLQSLVAKQAAILSRLDDLDQECSDLKEELWKVNNDRGELSSEVAEIQAQCTRLQQQLESEKVSNICGHAYSDH